MLRKLLYGSPQPSKLTHEFKLVNSYEKRKKESARLMKKHIDRIPIIIERSRHSDLPDIENSKFLVSKKINVAQLIIKIRQRIPDLNPQMAIYIFVANTVLPSGNAILDDIYKKHSDQDGFLYVTYAAENAFG